MKAHRMVVARKRSHSPCTTMCESAEVCNPRGSKPECHEDSGFLHRDLLNPAKYF